VIEPVVQAQIEALRRAIWREERDAADYRRLSEQPNMTTRETQVFRDHAAAAQAFADALRAVLGAVQDGAVQNA
jgi:hypothetical protein